MFISFEGGSFRPLTGNGIFNYRIYAPINVRFKASSFRPLTGNGIFNLDVWQELEDSFSEEFPSPHGERDF